MYISRFLYFIANKACTREFFFLCKITSFLAFTKVAIWHKASRSLKELLYKIDNSNVKAGFVLSVVVVNDDIFALPVHK